MRMVKGLLLALVTAGCYSPNIPNGMQKCAAGGACAAGFTCGPDGLCYKNGTVPPPMDVGVVQDMAAHCSQADCKAPKGVCDPDSGQCVECLTDTQCPDGKLCKAKACTPGCSQGHGCGDAGVCDTNSGQCKVCMADGDCGGMTPRCDTVSGRCVPCLPTNDNCTNGMFCQAKNGSYACVTGCKMDSDCMAMQAPDGGAMPKMACCQNVCTDVKSDAANCGVCGRACMNGQGCCGGSCTDETSDLANCGGCGVTCSGQHANWACMMSSCAITTCQGSYADCNMMTSDGCEANTAADPKNCGGCGKACNLANATAGCANGCFIMACNQGFADCNKMAGDGCEANVAVDKANCGACGKVCGNVPNGFPACVNSGCVVGACINGFADCDMQFANGCEQNVNTSAQACGGCGMPCSGVNATPSCANGACNSICNAGFANCDNTLRQNGCNVNLKTDPNNCGQCGVACGNGNICNNGVCGGNVCGNQLVDNAQTLCVPAGQMYTLTGDHCWTASAVINGTLVVKPFDGMTTGGAIILRSPSITVAAGAKIVGDAAGRLEGDPAPANGGFQGTGASPGCAGGPGNSVGQGGSGGGYGGPGGTPQTMTNWAMPCNMCNNPTLAHCYGPGGMPGGSSNGTDIDMGSGGGAGGNSSGCTNAGGRGGRGGASILLLGKTVKIDGTISSLGETPPVDPSVCGYHPGGGGGAGGGITVRADTITGTGALLAGGGTGGMAPGQNGDWGWAGGGGGGGRVKVFATTDTFGGMISVSGGAGGPACAGGSCFAGLPGGAGTSFRSMGVIPPAYTMIGCGGF